MSDTKLGLQIMNELLTEIGRITTDWAAFEHQVDLTLWKLAGVEKRLGACITTQMGSIHGKFRALVALSKERNVGQLLITELNKLENKMAQPLLDERNKYAHSSIWAAITDGRFAPQLRVVKNQKSLTFEDQTLSLDDLKSVTERNAELIISFGDLRRRILDGAKLS